MIFILQSTSPFVYKSILMRISIYVTLCDFVTVLHFYSYGSFLQIIIQRLLLLQFLLALLLFLRCLQLHRELYPHMTEVTCFQTL